jgi:uncharacterized protein YuzE
VHIEYDPESDAAFVWLVEDDSLQPAALASEVWPAELNEHIGLLFNANNQLVGIEVLFASRYLSASVLGPKVRHK